LHIPGTRGCDYWRLGGGLLCLAEQREKALSCQAEMITMLSMFGIPMDIVVVEPSRDRG
jgi:hypothetical protein